MITTLPDTQTLQSYFNTFREHILGIDTTFESPYNKNQKIVYADWTASGRLYQPIEEFLIREIYPFVGNTHTETNTTGQGMTLAYHQALNTIKQHVHAGPEDLIFSSHSGMTGVVNKFQRMLGLKIHEKYRGLFHLKEEDRPIVFITHMEHHSNQTSWLETIADVEIIPPDDNGHVNLNAYKLLLEKYAGRKIKIASVTACSNVTGIFTPYYEIAELTHRALGYCFVDFACAAPYIDIDMHPENKAHQLDAIYFSPHKFLGGPGTTGILIFHKSLYHNSIPDEPGGGTVDWTNPWGGRKYVDDIEAREDGGTPAFLQTIKAALCIKLKEEMGAKNMLKREKEQLHYLWEHFIKIPDLHILAGNTKDRLCILSFYIDGLHYNLGVKLLNDRFGIQVRGGCSCAGTYGHYLLHVQPEYSKKITDLIDHGDYSEKPGWIRLSIHPTATDEELTYIAESITALAQNFEKWSADYKFDHKNNFIEFHDPERDDFMSRKVDGWFKNKF
jgi:selenocysteine lyase/cysteine desulfurase